MLHIYNTLTKKEEEFKPINDREVGMYSCGPTVYGMPHIGNYRAFIFADILKRTLRYLGFEVKHVMNITDVDDKMIKRSQEAGKNLKDFIQEYVDGFHKESSSLNILPPNVEPFATDHIDEMVSMIEKLLEKGLAYKSEDGSVYFSIEKFADYGKLSGIDKSKISKSRIKGDEYEKENVQDFALWKAWDVSDGEVFWETSLGKGRPGWHIECSAMATKYLGNHFDIHTGGIDLEFPHHENEIAQSEGSSQEKFANYWLHNSHILIDNKKMSKSLKNDYKLADIQAKGFSPIDYRYFLLQANYRNLINFTWEALTASKNALSKLKNIYLSLGSDIGAISAHYKKEFTEALEDNLNTPAALAVMWTLANDKEMLLADKKATLLDFDKVLGLGMETWIRDAIPEEVLTLARDRANAKASKDWTKADSIRDEIAKLGYEILDKGEDFEVRKM
ncbi:MAG: cysteine--tRNA ligase [Bacteroidetes bacterium]|nr:cysteine--tRNA ligase [Bacteroidota bacterium]